MLLNSASNFLSSLSIRLGRAFTLIGACISNKFSLLGLLFCMVVFSPYQEVKADHVYAKSISYQRVAYNPGTSVQYNVTCVVSFLCTTPLNAMTQTFNLKALANFNNRAVVRRVQLNFVDTLPKIRPTQDCGCSAIDNLCFQRVRFQGTFTATGRQADINWDIFDDELISTDTPPGPDRGLVRFVANINRQDVAFANSSADVWVSPNVGTNQFTFSDNNRFDVIPFCLQGPHDSIPQDTRQFDFSIPPVPGLTTTYQLIPTLAYYNDPNNQFIRSVYNPNYSANDPLGPYGDIEINQSGILRIRPEVNNDPNRLRIANFVVTIRVLYRDANGANITAVDRNVMFHGRAKYTYDRVTASQIKNDPWLNANGLGLRHRFANSVTGNIDLRGTSLSIGSRIEIDTNIQFITRGNLFFNERANMGFVSNSDDIVVMDTITLRCCNDNDTMWNGINCTDRGRLIMRTCTLQCADRGIAVSGGGHLDLRRNVFDQNWQHIQISALDRSRLPNPVPIRAFNNLFSCTNTLIGPRLGQITFNAIAIRDNPDNVGIRIGVENELPNIFQQINPYTNPNISGADPASSAIYVDRSNANIVNNVFRGTAVNSYRYGIRVSTRVPEVQRPEATYELSIKNNSFTGIRNGILINPTTRVNHSRVDVINNSFTNILSSDIQPDQNGVCVNISGTRSNGRVRINSNPINNTRSGIYVAGRLERLEVNGNDNIRNASGSGIIVENIIVPTGINNLPIEITGNRLFGQPRIGIFAYLWNTQIRCNIDDNTVENATRGILAWGSHILDITGNVINNVRRENNGIDGYWGEYVGIGLKGVNMRPVNVINNRVEESGPNGNIVTSSDLAGRAAHGIFIKDTPNGLYCNNITTGMEHGITAQGSCLTSLIQRNTMQNNFFGFTLANQGTVGAQSAQVANPNAPPAQVPLVYDNQWLNLATIPGRTNPISLFSYSSDGRLSPFTTRRDLLFNPLSGGMVRIATGLPRFLIPVTPLTIGNEAVATAGADCADSEAFTQGDDGGGIVQQGPGRNYLSRIQIRELEAVARVANPPVPPYGITQQYIAEQQLYRMIRTRPNLRNRSAILDSFWTVKQGSNLALLDGIAQYMNGETGVGTDTACSIACGLLAQFQPQNQAEINHKIVYTHLAARIMNEQETFTTLQINDLKTVARQCPLSGGLAVTDAKGLLHWDGIESLDSVSTCDTLSYQFDTLGTQPRWEQTNTLSSKNDKAFRLSMYPNPATDFVQFHYQMKETDFAQVDVYNIQGIKVKSLELVSQDTELNLPLKDLTAGTYICKITVNGSAYNTFKLIVE